MKEYIDSVMTKTGIYNSNNFKITRYLFLKVSLLFNPISADCFSCPLLTG